MSGVSAVQSAKKPTDGTIRFFAGECDEAFVGGAGVTPGEPHDREGGGGMEMSRTGLTAGELPPVLPLAMDPAVSPSHGTYPSGSTAGVPATAAQCRWIADDIAGEMARFRMFRRSAANSLLKSGGYGALVAASIALRDDADSDASLLNSLL